MNNQISNQMLCAIGENLVSANLTAHGWPCANVNSSIKNFKGIDIYCQKGLDSTEGVGIQVKASMKKGFLVGLNCGEAADLNVLKQKITGPWIFVHIKALVPLEAEYYVLSRQELIDILYEGHDWYLNKWNRPATESLKTSPAAISLKWLRGENDKSNKSSIQFQNPYSGDIFRSESAWDNIWK